MKRWNKNKETITLRFHAKNLQSEKKNHRSLRDQKHPLWRNKLSTMIYLVQWFNPLLNHLPRTIKLQLPTFFFWSIFTVHIKLNLDLFLNPSKLNKWKDREYESRNETYTKLTHFEISFLTQKMNFNSTSIKFSFKPNTPKIDQELETQGKPPSSHNHVSLF